MRIVWRSISICTLAVGCSAPAPQSGNRAQVQRILDDPRYEWITIETPESRIHFPVGSFAQANSGLLPAQVEKARRRVLLRLNVTGYANAVDVFYIDSRHDMANLVGSPATGFAYYGDGAIVLVFNETWRAFESHEMTHVVTLGTWEEPHGPAVVEGLATYVDGFCGGYENGSVTRTILNLGAGIPLETLATEFRAQDDLSAYLLAASELEFVVQRHGTEAIRVLWDRGLLAAPELLEVSVGEFESRFGNWLASEYDPIPPGAWDAIREAGCGIDARSKTH